VERRVDPVGEPVVVEGTRQPSAHRLAVDLGSAVAALRLTACIAGRVSVSATSSLCAPEPPPGSGGRRSAGFDGSADVKPVSSAGRRSGCDRRTLGRPFVPTTYRLSPISTTLVVGEVEFVGVGRRCLVVTHGVAVVVRENRCSGRRDPPGR